MSLSQPEAASKFLLIVFGKKRPKFKGTTALLELLMIITPQVLGEF